MTQPIEESVFDIVERLVQPVDYIAEMLKIGDADQARFHELIKILLGALVDLGEEISQGQIDLTGVISERGPNDKIMNALSVEVARIVFDLRDSLSSSATSLSGRRSNMRSMDAFADTNATARFITASQFSYACNHEPTIRKLLNKVNLLVVTKAAKNQEVERVLELKAALEAGLDGRV